MPQYYHAAGANLANIEINVPGRVCQRIFNAETQKRRGFFTGWTRCSGLLDQVGQK